MSRVIRAITAIPEALTGDSWSSHDGIGRFIYLEILLLFMGAFACTIWLIITLVFRINYSTN